MIVCLRGTNGAGKTTAFRELFAGMVGSPVHAEHHRKPIGTIYNMMSYKIFVLGHYEDSAVNGGFDTLPNPGYGHMVIRKYARKGMRVLYEGRAHAADIDFVVQNRVLPVYLVVPTEVCEDSVRQRGHKISLQEIERITRRHEHERVELQLRQYRFLETDRESVVQELRKIMMGDRNEYDNRYTY